ncbi:MAG: MarC family protein [Nitrososphaerales archaeon]|jgi:multiple antibiotic resistance protein
MAVPFLDELLKATVALLVVVDPAGLVPVVLALTKGMKREERRGTFRVALLVAIVLLVIFAVAGQELLALFGITVDSFMIAGGILLMILAMQMIFRGGFVGASSISADEVGVVPIAFPLLVGPGAITTTIVSLQTYGILVTLLSIVIVMFVAWLVLRYLDRIDSLLGKRGTAVLSTLMAVFIAAIAVQFILTGIQFYYPPG